MEVSDLTDQVVNQYKIKSLEDTDQFQDHYSAYEIETGQAIKLSILKHLYADNDDFSQDYLTRSQSLIQIRHPNLITYLTTGLIDGYRAYITAAPVSGFSLGERLARLKQEGELAHSVYALTLVKQAASGLALLERLGLYHYELTPNHISLKSVTLKSEDSVIVDHLDIPDNYAGAFEGYSEYASTYLPPEQLASKGIDGRSHVYSLGVILHEMLCGYPPQQPMSLWRETWYAIGGGSTLAELRPDLAPEVIKLVERSISKNPRQRYKSISAFDEALASALNAEETHIRVGSSSSIRRSRPIVLLPLLFLVCLVLGVSALYQLSGMQDKPVPSIASASGSTMGGDSATETIRPTISPTVITSSTMEATNIPTVEATQQLAVVFESSPSLTAPPNTVTSTASAIPTATPSQTATPAPSMTESATIAASATPAPTKTPQPSLRVQVSSANLRLGPGTVFESIGYVLQDEQLEIIARSIGNFIWLNVRTESGRVGWVAADVGELMWSPEINAIATAEFFPIPPTATFTPTPTETPVPPALEPTADSGSGGSSGGDDNNNPRSTPTPPF